MVCNGWDCYDLFGHTDGRVLVVDVVIIILIIGTMFRQRIYVRVQSMPCVPSQRAKHTNMKQRSGIAGFVNQQTKECDQKNEKIRNDACANIRRCIVNNQDDEAVQIFQDVKNSGVDPDVRMFNFLIHMLASTGRHHQATGLLNEMAALHSPKVMRPAFDMAINGCSIAKDWQLAVQLFERHKDIKFNKASWCKLCNVFRESRRWDLVLQLLEDLNCKHDIEPPRLLVTLSIAACGPEKQWQKALELFKGYDRMARPATHVEYNILMDCLAKNGRWKNCEAVMSQMKETEAGLNLVAFNTVLKAYYFSSMWQKALKMFHSADDLGLEPDVISYNTILHLLSRVGKYHLVLDYFIKLIEANVEPKHHTYDVVRGISKNYRYRKLIQNVENSCNRLSLMPALRDCQGVLYDPPKEDIGIRDTHPKPASSPRGPVRHATM